MSFTRRNVDAEVFSDLVAVDGRVVVDVGSGGAGFVAWLNKHGATAFGIECSEQMLRQSKESFDEPGQVGGVGQQLPFATESASVVSFMNSLHHVPSDQMEAALREAIRILVPGGLLYVLEPVAEGPGYETGKLVDDEAEVRQWAQEAMDAFAGGELKPVSEGRYMNRYTYNDIQDYFDVMVGVDQARAEIVSIHGDRIRAAFNRLGTPTAEGTAFDHPMHYRLFAVTEQ